MFCTIRELKGGKASKTWKLTMQELKTVQNQLITPMGEPISERQMEEQHLEKCIKVIQNNIDKYSIQLKEITTEIKELYDNYRSNNPELHNDLVIGLDIKSQLAHTRNKNLLALKKPYFSNLSY